MYSCNTIAFSLSAAFVALCVFVGLNPSGGAFLDLYTYHAPTVAIYGSMSVLDAMIQQNSASGPLYYWVVSTLGLGILGMRAFSIFCILVSLIFLKKILSRLGVRDPAASVLACAAIVVNPFVLGPGIWANPDQLTITFILGALWLSLSPSPKCWFICAVFFLLATLTRQSVIAFAVLPFIILSHKRGVWRGRSLVFLSMCMLAVVAFYLSIWGGLVPPNFQQHQGLSLSSVVQAIITFSICLLIVNDTGAIVAIIKKYWVFILALWPMFAALFLTVEFEGSGLYLRVQALLGPVSLVGLGLVASVMSLFLVVTATRMSSCLIVLWLISHAVFGGIFFQKYMEPYSIILAIFASYPRLEHVAIGFSHWLVMLYYFALLLLGIGKYHFQLI